MPEDKKTESKPMQPLKPVTTQLTQTEKDINELKDRVKRLEKAMWP